MTTTRPDDIGTQFPADVDDGAPLDPQIGRDEVDYSTGPEPRALATEAVTADAASPITQYKLIAVAEDTYILQVLEAGIDGAIETIAKPWQLRQTVFEAEDGVNGLTFEYENFTFRKVTQADGLEFFEEIEPRYYINVELMYASEVNDTDIEGVLKVELNTAAHHWAKVTGINRARIITIFEDYLSCVAVDENNLSIGDEFFVAKPTKLQKTPWDGKTITGGSQDISYTYLGIDFREATLVGGDDDGDMQEEVIVPRYGTLTDSLGDIIHYAQVTNGTGVLADDPDNPGEFVKVINVDLNVDGRAWVRSKVTT